MTEDFDFREQAEAIARQNATSSRGTPEPLSLEATQHILHELQVHHLELEMQNDELRRAQAELDVARARYFDLYDLAPVGYFTLSEGGLILEANLTAATLLGAVRGMLVKRPVTQFIYREDQDIYYRNRKALFDTGEAQTSDLRLVKADGTVFWAQLVATAAQDVEGAPTCRVVLSDSTERKRAEDLLRESEERYRTQFDHASEGICVLSGIGHLLEVNEAFARMHGYTTSEMQQMSLKDLDTPESSRLAPDRLRRLLVGEVMTVEVEHFHKDGHPFPLEVSASLVSLNGKPIILCFHRDITERKRAEAELQQRDEDLRTAQRLSKVGSWKWILDTNTVQWSEELCRINGHDPELPIPTFSEMACFYAPASWERLNESVSKALSDGKSYAIELDLIRKDETLRKTIARGEVDYDSHGKIVSLHGTVQDITERKDAEAAFRQTAELLRRSETKFRTLHDSTPDGVLLLDEHGAFIDCNPAAMALFGCSSREEICSKIPAALSPRLQPCGTDSRTLASQRIAEALRTGSQRFEWVHMRSDTGASFPAEVLLNAMELDGKTILQAVVHDITERKRIEAMLRNSERYKRALLDNFPFIVWLKDLESRFLAVNQSFAESFGFTDAEELVGKSDFDITIPSLAENYRADDRAVLASRQQKIVEEEIEASGVRKWFETYKAPVLGIQGEPVGTVGFARDITERKREQEQQRQLQSQFQQAQKMESLGILAGGVAHDMNNVLGAILGLASANLETQPAGSAAREAFQIILKAAERGGKMVKSLLRFSRQSPTEARELNLNDLLREEANLLERTTLAKVRLELDLASQLRPIRGDASALTHAFMNLCVNAVDAMPGNGTLTLRTRNVDNDWVEVVVEDTGTGMPREVLEKAMDPFFTTKEVGKGTGLGLSMVYSTVKAHQGQLEIQSEPGQGTRVRMRLPACEPANEAEEPEVAPRSEPPVGALKVLVVDDDELVQRAAQAVLEVLGHLTFTASCGEDALAQLEAGLQPDVVILDMNMPGLGGAGMLPRLRDLHPTLPVLLATGRADQTALDLVAAHPHVTLLSKPFTMGDLELHLKPRAWSRTSTRILVVDDDELIRCSTVDLLKHAGFRASSVESGQAALACLRDGEKPDAIILDLNMPDLNGIETLQQIRVLLPEVPVLIASGELDLQDLDCFRQPRVSVLQKPFSMADILARLEPELLA